MQLVVSAPMNTQTSILNIINSSTHLKKSFLQKSLFSLEKHRSERSVRQSKQRTQSECHDRSNTVTMYRSSIGLSQAVHVTIILPSLRITNFFKYLHLFNNKTPTRENIDLVTKPWKVGQLVQSK